MTLGKYVIKINRYSRVLNVGLANNVDFVFDSIRRNSSNQIIGDIKG